MSLFALLLFLLPLAYSPGPGNLFFAAHGARFGWRRTFPAYLGYHMATLMAALAVGAGLLLLTGPMLGRVLLWVGTGYVLWLALKLWRSSAVTRLNNTHQATLWDGAALLALNPKAWAIMAALFAQFPAADTMTVLGVALVFTLNNALAFALWAGLGQTILAHMTSETQVRAVNRSFALMLAVVALAMAAG